MATADQSTDDDNSIVNEQTSTDDGDEPESFEHSFTFEASGPITVRETNGSLTTTRTENATISTTITDPQVFADLYKIRDFDNGKMNVLRIITEAMDEDMSHIGVEDSEEWDIKMGGSVNAYAEAHEFINDSYKEAQRFFDSCHDYWLFDESATITSIASAEHSGNIDHSRTQEHLRSLLNDE